MTTGAPMHSPPGGGYPPQQMAAPKPADPARSAAIMLAVAAVLVLIGTVSKSWLSAGGGEVHVGILGVEACFESRCVDVPTSGLNMPGDIEAVMMIGMIAGFASAALAGLFGGLVLAGKQDRIPVPAKLAQICFGIAAFAMTYFLIRGISEDGNISWAGFPAIGGVVLAGAGMKKLTPLLTQAAQHAAFVAQPTLPSQSPQGYGQPHAQQSQPMQPYGQQGSQPYAQPGSQPYAQQSQPMQPYGQQGSQPYAQPMAQQGSQPYAQPYGQQGSQPYAQPMAQQGSQPYAQPQQPQQPQQPPMAAPHVPPPQQAATHACPRCGTQLQFVAQYQRWFCPREQQYV